METFKSSSNISCIITCEDSVVTSLFIPSPTQNILSMSAWPRLREHFLYAKHSTCSFHQTQVDFFEYLISDTGISTGPDKVQAVLQWTLSQIQILLLPLSLKWMSPISLWRQYSPSIPHLLISLIRVPTSPGNFHL